MLLQIFYVLSQNFVDSSTSPQPTMFDVCMVTLLLESGQRKFNIYLILKCNLRSSGSNVQIVQSNVLMGECYQ